MLTDSRNACILIDIEQGNTAEPYEE